MTEPDQMIQQLEQLIELCTTQYQLDGYNCLFVGPTGSGKSTLVSLLSGFQLTVERDLTSYNIEHNNNQFIIGNNGVESQTQIAKSFNLNNVQYWDCPGFQDTRGAPQQLLIAYNIYYLLKNANKLRIVLVISEADFSSNRHRLFVEYLNTLAEYFPFISNIWDCVMITISQVDVDDYQNVYNRAINTFQQLIIDNTDIILTNDARSLLRSITENNKLFIFTNPVQINDNYIFPDDVGQQFNQVLSRCTYSIQVNVRISIDVTIKNYLEQYVNTQQQEILRNTRQIQQQTIQSIRQKLLNCQYQELQDYLNVLQQIQQIRNLAELLVQINEQNQQLIGITQDILTQLISYRRQIQVYDKITQLLSINKPINLQPLTLQQWIHYYIDIQIHRQNSTLYIFGMIISTQTIQEKYMNTNNKEQLTNINVYCKDTFILSSNMTFNGINLKIYAKNWKTCNIPVIIDLSGKDGEIHEQTKALNGQGYDAEGNGKSGMDGLHGKHGQNGGNFNGIGRNYDDLSQLTIITSGGKGSNGQDGGDGSNGLDGLDDEIGPIMERHPDTLVSRHPYKWQQQDDGDKISTVVKLFTTFNGQFIEEYQSNPTEGCKGGNGGDGGAAGRAGISGKAGTVNINYNLSSYQIITTQHQDGICGQPGETGNRGIRYQYKGKYKNELIFYFARDDAKEINSIVEENEQEQKQNTGQIIAKVVPGLVTGGVTLGIGLAKTGIKEIAMISTQTVAKFACSAAGLLASFAVGLAVQGVLSVVSAGTGSEWIDKPTKVLAQDTKNGEVKQESRFEYQEPGQPLDAPENVQLILQYQQDICNRIPDIDALSNNNFQN